MEVEKILSLYDVDEKTGCHIWKGLVKNSHGAYGMVYYNKKFRLAHRVMWELHNGEIPKGMEILHTCDVGVCVNVAHMRLGTRLENERDKVSKMRQARKLDVETVLKIRDDPRSTRAIGKDFNVSSMTVSDIKRRKYWNHV